MNLYTFCRSCKTQSKIKSNASDRPELAMSKGEEFNYQCTNCLKNHKIHVNDVNAKLDYTIPIGGVILSTILTLFLLNFAGLIAGATLVIPMIIWQQQSTSVHAFNTYRI